MAARTVSSKDTANENNPNSSKSQDPPVRLIHNMSDSDGESDNDLLGFVPVHKKPKNASEVRPNPNNKNGKDMSKPQNAQSQGSWPSMGNNLNMDMAQNMQQMWWNQMPPWMNPMAMSMMWQMPNASNDQDQTSDDDDDDESHDDDMAITIPADVKELNQNDPLPGDGQKVSLDKHLENASAEEDIGPDVHPQVAKLVSKIWDKEQKSDIKTLFSDSPRPANTPCLQKVDLDEEVLADLSKRPQTKELDFSIRQLHHGITRAAICVTNLLSDVYDKDTPRQQLADKAVTALRILSYTAQTSHTLRKNQIKPVLFPEIRNKLCTKNASIAAINESHMLFGGDVPAQVKKGE